MIEFRHVSAGYNGTCVLKDISLSIPKGSLTALIGPNGCGKTTLLRAAVGQLPLQSGQILLDSRPITAYGRKEFARNVAFMPQVRSIPAISVQALVSHGRFPYLGLSRQMRSEDRKAVQKAMENAGVSEWAHRDLRTLSGGERQRVYIAMALAQDTDVIFLDEPTTYLDLSHQFELLELIQSLQQQGKTIVMVLHDLSHALRYSSQLLLMDQGHVISCGTPQEIYESGALTQVFHVQAHQTANNYYFTPKTK